MFNHPPFEVSSAVLSWFGRRGRSFRSAIMGSSASSPLYIAPAEAALDPEVKSELAVVGRISETVSRVLPLSALRAGYDLAGHRDRPPLSCAVSEVDLRIPGGGVRVNPDA